MNIFIPYLHFIGIMLMMSALFTEYMLIKSQLVKDRIRLLTVVDLVFGISAAIVIVSGLLRWFLVDAKGAGYFNTQPFFHIKLTLFVLMIVLSIFPSRKFHSWKRMSRKDDQFEPSAKEVRKQLLIIRIEMTLMLIIPILAVLVNQGIRM